MPWHHEASFHMEAEFKGAGLSLLVLRAGANRGCPVLHRGEGNQGAH